MSNPNKTVFSQLIVLFKLAGPIILGNFAFAILGITDMMMAGMAGTPDQAGVAVGGSFFFPAITFVIGMVSALHPIVSRHCGARTKELIPQAHAHSIAACLAVGLVLMVILLLLAQFAIEMDTSERMEEVARFFVTCVAFCVPISALYANGRAYCEAMGVTSTTLYFGLLAVVLNVPLCYVLIFGHFGLPALGGKGCGVATLCSLSMSTVIMYLYISLHPKLKDYSVLKNRSGINFQGIKDFIKLALPLGISSSVECSCFALIALLLSPLGPTVVSAHTITMSLTSFTFNIPLSLGIASSIMVGYAIGKNNLNTLRLNIKAGYWAMLISISVSVAILVGGRNHLPRLFSHDEAVLALAGILIFFASFNQLFESTQTIQAFMLRGFKDTLTILGVTFVAFYCVALTIGVSLCYGYLHIPYLETLIGDPQTGLEGPRGFWVGLACGLVTASILYRLRVLKHYRNLKAVMQQEQQGKPQSSTQLPEAQQRNEQQGAQ